MMLRFVSGTLGIYGGYSIVASYQAGYWLAVVTGVVCLIAAVALWFKKPWSQYLVYFIAILFTGSWLWIVWKVWEQGWPYEGILQSLISLIPGALMVIVAIGSMVVVHRAFSHER